MTNEQRHELIKTFAEKVDDEPGGYLVECKVNIPVKVIYKNGIPIYHSYAGNDYWRLVPLSLKQLVDEQIVKKASKK